MPLAHHLVETLRGVLARELDDVVADERHELDLVAVGVDHRVVEPRPDARDLVARDERRAHDPSSGGRDRGAVTDALRYGSTSCAR